MNLAALQPILDDLAHAEHLLMREFEGESGVRAEAIASLRRAQLRLESTANCDTKPLD